MKLHSIKLIFPLLKLDFSIRPSVTLFAETREWDSDFKKIYSIICTRLTKRYTSHKFYSMFSLRQDKTSPLNNVVMREFINKHQGLDLMLRSGKGGSLLKIRFVKHCPALCSNLGLTAVSLLSSVGSVQRPKPYFLSKISTRLFSFASFSGGSMGGLSGSALNYKLRDIFPC